MTAVKSKSAWLVRLEQAFKKNIWSLQTTTKKKQENEDSLIQNYLSRAEQFEIKTKNENFKKTHFPAFKRFTVNESDIDRSEYIS